MNNEKLTFEEVLKGLYQYQWVSMYLIILLVIYIGNYLALWFFLPLIATHPYIYDFFDYILIILATFGVFLITIISMIRSKRGDKHDIFLTNSNIGGIIENISDMDLFEKEEERLILEKNFKSLFISEKIHDYKYSMIMMGSIIEFLLIRYCNNNNIDLEPYTNPMGNVTPANKKHLCNYIQSAIKYDILGQKNSWYLIQNNLRNFRNYVHISKEIKEEPIDYDWYLATKGVFDRIIRNFKPTTEKI